jgi:hypothetical protein
VIPRVYGAIGAVAAAFARRGIAKDRVNLAEDYAYRSIDDVLARLAPLLAEHRLCVLPRVLEREVTERHGSAAELLVSVALKVAYDLVSLEDGSSHTVEVFGEALDPSDKATAKALQSAYKYAMIQAFAIPVTGSEDADANSPRLGRSDATPEPVQGWEQWCEDIREIIRMCESSEALDRLQKTQRATLAALQREQHGRYTELGKAIAARRTKLDRAANALADSSAAPGDETPAEVAADSGPAAGKATTVPTRPRARRRRAGEQVLADA